MRMRMLQIGCLLVIGLLVGPSRVAARSPWEGPCVGKALPTVRPS